MELPRPLNGVKHVVARYESSFRSRQFVIPGLTRNPLNFSWLSTGVMAVVDSGSTPE